MNISILLAGLCLSLAAQAQTYLNKPVKFVVPFPPGGNLDFVAIRITTTHALLATIAGNVPADVKEKFAAAGLETVSSAPAEFSAFIRSEIAKWGRVAKEASIKVDQ